MRPRSIALAPDPAVPQRDHLMDLDAIARLLSMRLGRHGSIPIRSCRLGCVTYRPGKRLRVVYQVGIDGRDLHIVASTFRDRSSGERAYQSAMGTARCSGPLRPVVYDAGLETVFWMFPNDRKIENLPTVAGAEEDLTGLVDRCWVRSRLVDYKPETSAVVGCLDGSDRLIGYAKVHAGDEGERTHRVQKALARLAQGLGSGPRIARPLAYSTRHRTLLVEPIVGTPIGQLTGPGLLAGLHAYGAALAALHCLPLIDIGTGRRDALGRLRHKAEDMRTVRPDVEAPVSELLRELRRRWEEAAGGPVLIHGDTNEYNAILQEDHTALIDFERACIGAAGSDIGNFLGTLRYFRSLGLISPGTERAQAAAFTRGYSSIRALPHRESLRVHESAALAERAFRSVTRLRGPALPRVPALLEEAKGLLR